MFNDLISTQELSLHINGLNLILGEKPCFTAPQEVMTLTGGRLVDMNKSERLLLTCTQGSGFRFIIVNIVMSQLKLGKSVMYVCLDAPTDLITSRIQYHPDFKIGLLRRGFTWCLDKLRNKNNLAVINPQDAPASITKPFTLSDIYTALTNASFKPDLLVVDYLQLMGGYDANDPESMLKIKEGLSYLADVYGMAVVAVSVENKAGINLRLFK